jgi:hypothetical protein
MEEGTVQGQSRRGDSPNLEMGFRHESCFFLRASSGPCHAQSDKRWNALTRLALFCDVDQMVSCDITS